MIEWVFYIGIFFISAYILHFAGGFIVGGLSRTAKFLGWKVFVVEFFVISFAASLPNLFVGLSSAARGIPELSFGDIMGNGLVALTLGVGLALLSARREEIPARGSTLQTTAIFTAVAAVLPIVFLSDGLLSRSDGLVMIFVFIFYVLWLFSKKERFERVYESEISSSIREWKVLVVDVLKMFAGVALLVGAAQGIVYAAVFMAAKLQMPLALVGLVIVGFGSALPEIYFAMYSARTGKTNMVLGNLMGAVIIPSSLVLGIVVLIHPIIVHNVNFFTVSRFFLVLSSVFFITFIRSSRKVGKYEAYALIALYIVFVITVLLLY